MDLDDIFKQRIFDNSKHDQILQCLIKDLKETQRLNNYEKVFFNAQYEKKSKTHGDIDLLLKKGDYLLQFEVKINNRRTPIKQLNKAKRKINSSFPGKFRIFNIYVHGFNDKPPTEYKIKWIKNKWQIPKKEGDTRVYNTGKI